MDELIGRQAERFSEAVQKAFDPDRFDQMLFYKLGKNRARYSSDRNRYPTRVFEVIQGANQENWWRELIFAAREANPANPALLLFHQELGLSPQLPSEPEQERIIRRTNQFVDVAPWQSRLATIEFQVCRIEVQTNRGPCCGTGFLVADDVVLTNYHVLEPVIRGQEATPTPDGRRARPTDVTFLFDYKRSVDKTLIHPGTPYKLAKTDWELYSSPYDAQDRSADGKDTPRPTDCLDFTLVRLDGRPGAGPVGQQVDPTAPLRGYVALPAGCYAFEPNTPLFIVQHPEGGPLQLALDTEGVLGLNPNRTRVRYKTNTLPGSSGSPCFNSDWELIALHHAGDPNWNPGYNQGIPISTILDLLQREGKRGLLPPATG
jgi:hypothetical protein